MSRNNQRKQGVQQMKGPFERLNDIQLELRAIQQGQQAPQQDETVSPSTTTDTEPDTSPQSINPRNQTEFFPPLGSISSTSVANRQGGNYLYPGVNRGRSLRQPGRASVGPTSSTSVGKQQEQYNYFNDPTITPEERNIRLEARNIRQARVREENPNLDLEKWRKDDEAIMRRHSLNIKNRRLGNAPTSFDNDLGPTSSRPLLLGRRYAPDMSSSVTPHHFGTTSSTSGGNDLAPDQNDVESLRGYSVTSNTPIGGPVPPRMSETATRREKRRRQQRQQQEQPDRKRPRNEKGNTNP